MDISFHSRESRKGDKFTKVVPFRSMLNTENQTSVYSMRYSEIKQASIIGVGRVFLAERERTVILAKETEAYGLKSDFILTRTNAQLKGR